MEYLSGDFYRGYTKAIQDITRDFEIADRSLKYCHKRMTSKTMQQFLKCYLENRAVLRENIGYNDDSFLRWNPDTEDFELYTPKL